MTDNRAAKAIIFILIAGFILILWIGHQRSVSARQEYARKQEKERLELLACERGEYCSDFEAWRRSSGKYYPVRLPTGEYYFYGSKCMDKCEGHVAGYKWAIDNEIISYNRCSTESQSFNDGCETGVISNRVDHGLE